MPVILAPDGFKAIGAFHGRREWCEQQLDELLNGTATGDGDGDGDARVGGKLSNLDLVDQIKNTERICNAKQLQHNLVGRCAAAKPCY